MFFGHYRVKIDQGYTTLTHRNLPTLQPLDNAFVSANGSYVDSTVQIAAHHKWEALLLLESPHSAYWNRNMTIH
ncbi:Uncharacterised protein [Vibrio anguillarum]|nr:Uncharacterised protein [Vibrio anguillarum]